MDELLPSAPDYPRAVYQSLLRIERILLGGLGRQAAVERESAIGGAPDKGAGMLSIVQAAQRLGIGRTKVDELLHANKLLHVKLGRRVVIPERAIDLLLHGVTPDEYLAGQRNKLRLDEKYDPLASPPPPRKRRS
jgi:excisionase family DNA binding protein